MFPCSILNCNKIVSILISSLRLRVARLSVIIPNHHSFSGSFSQRSMAVGSNHVPLIKRSSFPLTMPEAYFSHHSKTLLRMAFNTAILE